MVTSVSIVGLFKDTEALTVTRNCFTALASITEAFLCEATSVLNCFNGSNDDTSAAMSKLLN